jgi:MFS family permease
LALAYGRRTTHLISFLGCLAQSEWTAWIAFFPQWAAARIFFGFFVAPMDVLPEISIPDMYFAWFIRRGLIQGISRKQLHTPLIAGFVNYAIGWGWVQHLVRSTFSCRLFMVKGRIAQ